MPFRTTILALAVAVCAAQAFDAKAGFYSLYVTDAYTHSLYELNTTDGSATLIGPFGVATTIGSLAYDAAHDVVYGLSSNDYGSIYTVNRATGTLTYVATVDIPGNLHGLAYNSDDGMLYVSAPSDDSALFKVDPQTGQTTLVGMTGFVDVSGLDFHPVTNVLYGGTGDTSGLYGELITIDHSSGFGTLIGPTHHSNSVAFHPDTLELFAISNGAGTYPDALYSMDADSGAWQLIGQTGLGNNLGMVFAPIPTPATLALVALGGFGCRRRRRGVIRH